MKLLFIIDPPASLKAYKDTSVAMMRAAQARNHDVFIALQETLHWSAKRVSAAATRLSLTDNDEDWYRAHEGATTALKDFDAVLMRKDPPFDLEYVTSTWFLSAAEREGARVFNKAASLRDHPEKLAILEFPEWITPTLVTRSEHAVRAFHAEHGDIIVKPLDGMGGRGIFRVGADGMNLGAIVETIGGHGTITVMVQRFLPEIVHGDKRILLIDGEPVPYCLARIPQGSEVRGNLAVGGKGVAQPLSASDREIAQALGAVLRTRGLLLVGLDVIGDRLTEINVTSPTCFQEIAQQTGFDVARMFVDALERALAS